VNPVRLRSLLERHRVAVALWLSLLVACGQTAASMHLLSHASAKAVAAVGDRGGNPLLDRDDCDLCFAAVTLASAAPLLQLQAMVPAATGDAAPQAARMAVADIAARLAYRSRAPPSSPR
jgi:hypothetical protein